MKTSQLRLHPNSFTTCSHCEVSWILRLVFQISGTHLTFELIHMLTRRKAELSQREKETQTLELQPEEVLSSLPSPRILNTHVQFHLLPTQVRKKKTKIIYLMRDPRDVIVSRFVLTNQYGANERTVVGFDEYLVASVEGKGTLIDCYWFELWRDISIY